MNQLLLVALLGAAPAVRPSLEDDAKILQYKWNLRYREEGHRAWVAFGLYKQKDGSFSGPANLEVRIPDGLWVAGVQTMDDVRDGKVVGTKKVPLYTKKGEPTRLTIDPSEAATKYKVYSAPSISYLVEERGERFIRFSLEGEGDIVFRYRILGKTIRLECVKCERLGRPQDRGPKVKLQATHFTGEFSRRAFHPLRERWSPAKAKEWAKATPWLSGGNYLPASAINQLEMWQKDTFDPDRIDKELGWAEDLGFTSMRVFLHHLLWEDDKEGFLKRLDRFLAICEKRKIRPMLVLFDSCWDPDPKLGKQRAPAKGVHNSGWVQSPGSADLKDKKRHKLLEDYVKGVVGKFKDDKRVIAWDVWNEPDNLNDNSYGKNKLKTELPDKHALTLPLLKSSFVWAREANPSQPITSGVWLSGHKADPKRLNPFEKIQLDESDIITFHAYDKLDGVKEWVANLKKLGRPLACTEYMARPHGSTFDPILGYFKEEGIGAYCWGFVAGKSNTIFAWDTWQKPEKADEPKVWFHDIFRADGSPFDKKEIGYIRRITGKAK